MALTKVTGGLLGNLPTGTGNVAVGDTALDSIASGATGNVAIGSAAGTALTTGDGNVAVGFEALKTEDANGESTAVGYQALKTQNAGDQGFNTAVGYQAGTAVTTGVKNTLLGARTGVALTTGSENTVVGRDALFTDTLGSKSVAIGQDTLASQNFTTATDTYNTAVGYAAGLSVTTGVQNTIVGGLAGDALTDADFNVALGYATLSTDTLGSKSTAVGYRALTTQNFTTATDAFNTAVGTFAGFAVTTGAFNTLIGGIAADALTTGQENVALGYFALSSDTKGNHSVALGKDALATQNFTTSTDTHNTAVGHSAGVAVTTGVGNTFLGSLAGTSSTGSGVDNNTFIGFQAGRYVTSGEKNTILGRYDGNQGGLDIRILNNNIILSDGDGNGRFRANGSGQVVVGDSIASFGGGGYTNTAFTVNQDSNDYITALRVNTGTAGSAYGLFIDYTSVAPNNSQNNFITVRDTGGIRFLVKSNGGINNYQANDANLSDERVKKDISLLGSMWDKFKAIEIVNFKYKDQTHENFNIGVIAQQVESVAPEFIDNSGFGETTEGEDPLKAVFTADLYHAAIKALQEAMTRIETLEAEVTALKEG